MLGALEISLGVSSKGVTPRAYTSALQELTYSLEEVDRLMDPDPKSRTAWFISDTSWREFGPRILLRPDETTGQPLDIAVRASQTFVRGVRGLQHGAAIPEVFTERVVQRVEKVSSFTDRPATGLTSVQIAIAGGESEPVALDHQVRENAHRAIAPTSLAYGSLIGRLDKISARGRSPQIGLRPDHGNAVTCNVRSSDVQAYLDSFSQRVLVDGIVRRNGSGQIIRIDADRVSPIEAPRRVAASELQGYLGRSERSISEFIEEQRGR